MAKIQSGWIYVLDDQRGFYKIGKTIDFTNRVKQLRIQLPYRVEIAYAFQSSDIHEDELILHEYFADKRSNGEWFALDLDDLGTIHEHCNFTGFYEVNGQLVSDCVYEKELIEHEVDYGKLIEQGDELLELYNDQSEIEEIAAKELALDFISHLQSNFAQFATREHFHYYAQEILSSYCLNYGGMRNVV